MSIKSNFAAILEKDATRKAFRDKFSRAMEVNRSGHPSHRRSAYARTRKPRRLQSRNPAKHQAYFACTLSTLPLAMPLDTNFASLKASALQEPWTTSHQKSPKEDDPLSLRTRE